MRRLILITLLASIFVIMMGMTCITPFLGIYAKDFGATGLQISLIFISYNLSRMLLITPLGYISDTYGRRRFLLGGLLIYSVLSWGYLWSNGVWSLCAMRLIQGLAGAAVLPITMAYVGELAPKGEEGRYVGYYQFAFVAGIGAGPLFGGILYDIFNIQASFYALGALSFLALLMVYFFLPREEKNRVPRPLPRNVFFDISLWRSRIVQGICWLRLGQAFGDGINWTFFPLLAGKLLGISGGKIGMVISINLLINSFFQRPGGYLADNMNRNQIVVWGGVIFALLLFFIPWGNSFYTFLIINLALGLSGGLSNPALMAITVNEGRTAGMGAIMGLTGAFSSLGMILGPICGGLLLDRLGFGPIFALACVSGLLGILAFVRLEPKGLSSLDTPS